MFSPGVGNKIICIIPLYFATLWI